MGLELNQHIETIDNLIRLGRFNLATNALHKIGKNPGKIPRESLVKISGLCRRAGATLLGIKLLRPIVRPTNPPRIKHPASPAEMTEYAALLLRLGARAEALRLLAAIDSNLAPQALLIQAFAQFGKWDYERATPLLENYVGSTGITDYERLIGESNLVSAYVETRHPKAFAMLSEIKAKAKDAKANLLYGNLLAAETEFFIHGKSFDDASRAINEAKQILSDTQNIETLNLDKLAAVISKSPDQLTEVARNLRKVGAWENARDCVFQRACLKNETGLFQHLYFGTPHVRYRERIQSLGYCLSEESYSLRFQHLEPRNAEIDLPSLFHHNEELDESSVDFDVRKVTGALKLGQVPHRLLLCLIGDFYRPIRMAEIFDKIFPDQYFNPATSLALVHQAMHRLRRIFAKSSLPLEIVEGDFGFYLSIKSNMTIQVYANDSLRSDDLQIAFAREKLLALAPSKESFSRAEIQAALGLERCTALRTIKKLIASGDVTVTRAGPNTNYRLGKSSA